MRTLADLTAVAATAGLHADYASAGLLILRVVAGGLVAGHGVQKMTHLLGGTGRAGGTQEFRDDGFRGGPRCWPAPARSATACCSRPGS